MSRVQKAALTYLLLVAGFGWGLVVGRYEVFPFSALKELVDFARGAEFDGTSLTEKIANDIKLSPERQIQDFVVPAAVPYREVALPGVRDRREPALLHLHPSAPRGYRVIFGAFDFKEAFWGALLIDADGSIIHRWHLSTDDLTLSQGSAVQKSMYGTRVLPDGSVVFLMQEEGGGIRRVGFCGEPLWDLEGRFHHTVEPTDDGMFWTWEGSQWAAQDATLALAEISTGRVVRRITMDDIRDANPRLYIFDLQAVVGQENALHGNDIDPLPTELASDFPRFEPGDLLVSFKTQNLVLVLDPDDLKVKWWRIGPWDRQHDPDWNRGGWISVFSNNERSRGGRSDIVRIDPESLEHELLVDGTGYDFRSAIQGRHQVTSAGTVLITSGMQGRAFEVDAAGAVVFDFVNVWDRAAGEVLRISDAIFLEPDYFQMDPGKGCRGAAPL